MNLKYFRVFVSVYEHMSMSLAGEEWFLSQPAVSRIIREMETAYDCRFFLRHSGRLYRTESGERMYLHAKQLLSVADQMDDAMREQTRQRKVRIGATPTAGNYYLFDAVAQYRAEGGPLDVLLTTHGPATLEGMVKGAELDFAVVEGVFSSKEIRVRPLFSDQLVFVSVDGAPIPDPLPLLVLDRGHTARVQFEQTLLEAGLSYTIKGEFSDVEGVRRCAALGLGVGLLPRRAAGGMEGMRLIELVSPPLHTQFSLALHRQKYVFPELNQLISRLESFVLSEKMQEGAPTP